MNYVFNDNALTLYELWDGRSLTELAADSVYADTVKRLTPSQVNQYYLWLALPEDERQAVQNDLTEGADNVVVTVSRHVAATATAEHIRMIRGIIVSSQKLGNGYTEHIDNLGQVYLVRNFP